MTDIHTPLGFLQDASGDWSSKRLGGLLLVGTGVCIHILLTLVSIVFPQHVPITLLTPLQAAANRLIEFGAGVLTFSRVSEGLAVKLGGDNV